MHLALDVVVVVALIAVVASIVAVATCKTLSAWPQHPLDPVRLFTLQSKSAARILPRHLAALCALFVRFT